MALVVEISGLFEVVLIILQKCSILVSSYIILLMDVFFGKNHQWPAVGKSI